MMIGAHAGLVSSFPDFAYTNPSGDWKTADGVTTATLVVKGTHTGAPYSPMPGVAPVATSNAVCENDPEKIRVTYTADGTKLAKFEIEAVPGGKGFSGPPGFYAQCGGSLEAFAPSGEEAEGGEEAKGAAPAPAPSGEEAEGAAPAPAPSA